MLTSVAEPLPEAAQSLPVTIYVAGVPCQPYLFGRRRPGLEGFPWCSGASDSRILWSACFLKTCAAAHRNLGFDAYSLLQTAVASISISLENFSPNLTWSLVGHPEFFRLTSIFEDVGSVVSTPLLPRACYCFLRGKNLPFFFGKKTAHHRGRYGETADGAKTAGCCIGGEFDGILKGKHVSKKYPPSLLRLVL